MSGGIRYLRDWQFQSLNKESEKPPFPLKEFPKTLGDWHEVEGTEITLDPQIARIAGSSDHLVRTYINGRNGEQVSVMILYGLAYLVGHTHPMPVILPPDSKAYLRRGMLISTSPRPQSRHDFASKISPNTRRGLEFTSRSITRYETPASGD